MHHDAKHNLRTSAQPRTRMRFPSAQLTLAALLLPLAASAATFTVTNVGDSGPGSLRQAIEDANNTPGADMIAFAIPGSGPHSIKPLGWLPALTDPVTIDGFTQSGAFFNTVSTSSLMIELSGELADPGTYGLVILAHGCTVRGLAINRFALGLGLFGPDGFGNPLDGLVLEGNRIGTDVSGTVGLANRLDGVFLINATQVTVRDNVLSGNGQNGLWIALASDLTIQGNRIGTDSSGTVPLGNAGIATWAKGIFLDSCANSSVTGNVSSGNVGDGMLVWYCSGTSITGNMIGADVSGTVDLGNGAWGVNLTGSSTTTFSDNVVRASSGVGVFVDTCISVLMERNSVLNNWWEGVYMGNPSQVSARSNLASGNGGKGMWFNGGADLVIEDNWIGTDATGTGPAGNTGFGIHVNNATNAALRRNLVSANGASGMVFENMTDLVVEDNQVGTNAAGTEFLGNARQGIYFNNGTNVTIQRNLASANGANGIVCWNANGLTVVDNRAGTDAAGLVAFGNSTVFSGTNGILVGFSSNVDLSRNLVSGNLQDGLWAAYCENIRVADNLIGTDITGQASLGNANTGLGLEENTSLTATGNLIAGSGQNGVLLEGGSQLVFANNRVGTNAPGDALLPNEWAGMYVSRTESLLIEGNVVGGGAQGLRFFNCSDTEVRGNDIGVSANGATPLGNMYDGVEIQACNGVYFHENRVANNGGSGISISDGGEDVRVECNDIYANGQPSPDPIDLGPWATSGLKIWWVDGVSVIGNHVHENLGNGIIILGSSGNLIEGNEISGNDFGIYQGQARTIFPDGSVFEDPPTRANSMLANSIHDNAFAGIELVLESVVIDEDWNFTRTLINSGPDSRDLLDADEGVNDFLNKPSLQTAILKDGVLTAKGNLKGLPDSTQTVQVFASSAADPSGFGEGDIYLGEMTVTTNDEGNVHFNLPGDGSLIAPGMFITATATDEDGNTSEFSNAVVAKPAS